MGLFSPGPSIAAEILAVYWLLSSSSCPCQGSECLIASNSSQMKLGTYLWLSGQMQQGIMTDNGLVGLHKVATNGPQAESGNENEKCIQADSSDNP